VTGEARELLNRYLGALREARRIRRGCRAAELPAAYWSAIERGRLAGVAYEATKTRGGGCGVKLAVAFAVARYAMALRASVLAFRRYVEACVAGDPGAGALGVARQRAEVEVDEAHRALRELLEAS
jgi:hypothetical protein